MGTASPLIAELADAAVLATGASHVTIRRDLISDILSALIEAELMHRASTAPGLACFGVLLSSAQQLGHALDLPGQSITLAGNPSPIEVAAPIGPVPPTFPTISETAHD
ncbi:MAG TPA: hypothetical protein VF628_11245 [Allosphingosinicella sp.]|jgi:hypothetical protein